MDNNGMKSAECAGMSRRTSSADAVGKTGTGKSTLLESMALQDLEHGQGFALVDPHGDLVEQIASHVPAHRRSDVLYIDAADPTQPYGYNPLRQVRRDRIALAASGMMEAFKKMWPEAWGVRWLNRLHQPYLV
jgi:hypothetical protein